MKKQQYLDELEERWAKLNASFAGLTDEQLTTPGVTGDWSVKDILAHVSWWEEESIKHLPVILEGEQPPSYRRLYGGIDAFNALMTEQWRVLTLSEVRKRLEMTHKGLMDYLQGVPEEQYTKETRFRRRLGWDSYKHYPLHTLAIIEWREQAGLE